MRNLLGACAIFVLASAAMAETPDLPPAERIHTVEFNLYGGTGPGGHQTIWRDEFGRLLFWRVYQPDHRPDGSGQAFWFDQQQKEIRIVRYMEQLDSKTRHDRALYMAPGVLMADLLPPPPRRWKR